ncbi:putative serine/threonine-protein kinase isoform X2 [Momordica charantia]|uniref:Serine/threonine-protein kinase isoform X2 n=1 Tax=Momordica charantia TaxID=3673 RepID=A0A6J1CQ47_MOMCH|nr:putative serine/threonine-protein kinase isoform X2 [Momordica charantia]
MKFRFLLSSCCSARSPTAMENGCHDRQDNEGFRIYSYNELKSATRGFSAANKVGEGGFGSVYKGRLRDGRQIAVKVLSIEKESMRGEREFISELTSLSNIRHENLVGLKGCCVDGSERYLVYDYMENNSLAYALQGVKENRTKLSWQARKDILIGVARGLAYLHEELRPHIVHRDIKASNILLGHDFMPKVADFGLARLLRDNHSHVSTRVAGTIGYLAPEYAVSGHLTRKSDVYSFGVLLLEIVSGRATVDFDLEHGEHHLVQKVWEHYKANELVKLVDPVLDMDFPKEEIVRFMKIGLLCVQENTTRRPQMSLAVSMLMKETDLKDHQISQPGHIIDFMDIKMGKGNSSTSIFSKVSSPSSMQSF